jgi:hypothetical protein
LTILGSEYKDRWSKYASHFHSGANLSVEVTSGFNDSLYRNAHFYSWNLLRERNTAAETIPSKANWDRFLDLLCHVDTGTMIYGFDELGIAPPCLKVFFELWFYLWEVSLQSQLLYHHSLKP